MERLEKINKTINTKSGEYEFTTQGKVMTKEQRDFYEENGYLVVKGLLPLEDIEKWKTRFLDYCDEQIERPAGMALVRDISLAKQGIKIKGEAGVTKIQDWQDDEVLFTFCNHPTLIPYLKDFMGENIKSVHTMLINKPPNTGQTQRHPLHQDQAYFPFRPANKIVCAWTAMEDVTRDNGGLVIYPGSHKGPFLDHGYPDWKEGVNRGYWGIKNMPPESAVKVHPSMKAGDVVFFHPHIVHGSGVNKTQNFRKSISCHYAASDCYFIDIKGTFHEELASDVLDFAAQQYGIVGMDFKDIWRNKSRVVCGQEFSEGI